MVRKEAKLVTLESRLRRVSKDIVLDQVGTANAYVLLPPGAVSVVFIYFFF